MMKPARFIENETGFEVSAWTPFAWGGTPKQTIVTFRQGETEKIFSMPDDEFIKHFSIVTPQEVFVVAIGGDCDRPTPKQREISEASRVAASEPAPAEPVAP